MPSEQTYDVFFELVEQRLEVEHPDWGFPLFRQRANVRKFRHAGPLGSPRHYTDPSTGYQLYVAEGVTLRSDFGVYIPRNRGAANALERTALSDRGYIEQLYGGPLLIENSDRNAGASIYDAVDLDLDDETRWEWAVEWLLDTQSRLRNALKRTGIEQVFLGLE